MGRRGLFGHLISRGFGRNIFIDVLLVGLRVSAGALSELVEILHRGVVILLLQAFVE